MMTHFLSLKALAGIVLLMTIFLDGKSGQTLTAAVALVWLISNILYHFRPRFRFPPVIQSWVAQMKAKKEDKKLAPDQPKASTQPAVDDRQAPPIQKIVVPEVSADYKRAMLTHLNWRITDKLQRAFPGAAWVWCSKAPDDIAVRCGTARIHTYGTGDYNFADLSFGKDGQIQFNMIVVQNLADVKPGQKSMAEEEQESDTASPREWYELACAGKLKEIIDTISPHGFSTLDIQENGAVVILEGDDLKQIHHFQGFPTRRLWPELMQYLGADKISAIETGQALRLSWTRGDL